MKISKIELKNIISESLKEVGHSSRRFLKENTHRKDFYVLTDSEGKMPILSNTPSKISSHKYWVKYVNDIPVEVYPYPGQDRVWDYSTNTMLSLNKDVKSWNGKDNLKKYTGKIIKSSVNEGEPTWKDGEFQGYNSEVDKDSESCIPHKIKEDRHVYDTVLSKTLRIKESPEKSICTFISNYQDIIFDEVKSFLKNHPELKSKFKYIIQDISDKVENHTVGSKDEAHSDLSDIIKDTLETLLIKEIVCEVLDEMKPVDKKKKLTVTDMGKNRPKDNTKIPKEVSKPLKK